jgi:hypothetical protein
MSKVPLLNSPDEREIELKELGSPSEIYQPFPVSFSPSAPPIDAEKVWISRLEQSYAALKQEAQSHLGACTGTLTVIFQNIIKDPRADKFRRIRLQNQKFNREVGRFPSALSFLEVSPTQLTGFQLNREEDSLLVYSNPDVTPLAK